MNAEYQKLLRDVRWQKFKEKSSKRPGGTVSAVAVRMDRMAYKSITSSTNTDDCHGNTRSLKRSVSVGVAIPPSIAEDATRANMRDLKSTLPRPLCARRGLAETGTLLGRLLSKRSAFSIG